MASNFLGYFMCAYVDLRIPENPVLYEKGRGAKVKAVIINAYPKSGVTWLLRLVCDLLEGIHQDTPQMEPLSYGHPVTSDWIVQKAHYPYWEHAIPHLKGKIVVVTQRDPRDIVVSAMHYRGTSDLDLAISVMTAPKRSYAKWVESWLAPAQLKVKKLIITRYERLHSQPYTELKGIVNHLFDKSLATPSDKRIQEAVERQSFENMRKTYNDGGHFMRKGIVGDWKNHFNREQAKRFNVHFGQFMLEQGYVDNLEWWKDV